MIRLRWYWLVAVVCGLGGLAPIALSADPVSIEKFGREGTVKARLPHASITPQLLHRGVRVVADYVSFAVVEAPADAVPFDIGAELLPEENLIRLNAGAIDTTLPTVKQLQQPRDSFTGKTLHLVQFAGPVRPEWFKALEETGVQVVTYVPSNVYIVYGNTDQLTKVQTLASTSPQIQWQAAYLDEYKIDPALLVQPGLNAVKSAEKLVAIQLVADDAANTATLAVIDRLKNGPILNSCKILGYFNIIVPLPRDKVADLAKQPEVVSIQPYELPTHFCERQDQIVAGNLTGSFPSGPGYLAWLASRGFTQAQFDASGIAIDISDTGVDNGTTAPNHFGLYTGSILPGVSRIIYSRLVGTPHSGSTILGCDGHGNLNTHIICGYDDSAGFPFADGSGFHYGLGVCPFVRVGSSVIFDPTFTSPNYANVQSMAYQDGARISSNSWGFGSNAYTLDSQAYDASVRDAQPTGSTFPADGNQEMVIVFANGNAGSAAGTVRSPATAKNVISVGAAENVQSFGSSDGCGTTDSQANNANDIASFSSRGPCPDGRKKPDIVAPGTHISGGVFQANPIATGTGAADACFTASGVCGGSAGSQFFPNTGQQFYTASSGTSHATPAVAGGCALIRQFFINQGMSPPSPAMTKALLMNSARYMAGTGSNDTLWSNSQGMGGMNLGEAFNRGAVTPTILRDELAEDLFTASGQVRTFTGSVADSSKPFRITLAWTDAPGSTSGAAYKNNLDLTVSVGGNTYKGNVFAGANSVTGGSADAVNNVESVFLAAGVSGPFTITVTATNINSNGVPNVGGPLDQDFALVGYNAATCSAISMAPNSLPGAAQDTIYNEVLSGSGGTPSYSFAVASGALPDGLSLSSGGVLSGMPTTTGTSNFVVEATDAGGCDGTQPYSIAVVACSILGDLNHDGVINGNDIQAFVDCLTIGSTTQGSCPCGDYDRNTIVDSPDVTPFVNALIGP